MELIHQQTTTVDVGNWAEVEEKVTYFFNEGKAYLASEISHMVEAGDNQGELYIYSDPEGPETGAWLGTWEDGNERNHCEYGPITWRLVSVNGELVEK